MMSYIYEYRNSEDPLLRAAFWLVHFSWGGGEPDVQDPFDMLQKLSQELQRQSKIRTELLTACEAFVDVTAPLSRRTAGSNDVWEDTVRLARTAIAKARDER